MLGIAPLSTLPVSTLPDAGSTPSNPVCAVVSNAAQPQIANYSILAGIGFFLASVVSGQVPGANAQEYRHDTHAAVVHNAENIKTTIFRAQVTPPAAVTAVPPFISIGQQVYDDVRQTALTKPSIEGSTPTVRPVFTAGSQLVDLTLQPVITKPLITGQGPVPAATSGSPQCDPSQIAPQTFRMPPAVPNPIAAFFSTLPQDENRQLSTIWKSQVAGNTPPVIPFTRGTPQADPTQIDGQVFKPYTPIPIPVAVFFATLPQNENRQYSVVWKSQVAGDKPRAAPFILGSPQIDPTQIAAQLIRSSVAQVVEWVVVDDAQTGSWIPVVDTQSGSWTLVNDAQTGSWTMVNDTQTSSWTMVYDAQTANWVLVDDSQ